ncbi:MAG: MFS transporter [Rhizobiaceae bacterium]
MFQRRMPDWLRHAPNPGLRGFALLAALEAAVRGMLISVLPVAMYKAFADAQRVSEIYLAIGFCSLLTGLMVPWLTRTVPRRYMFSLGACLFMAGCALAIAGPAESIAFTVLLNSAATVIVTVCFNAYVLDYIAKVELGRAETLRLFYSALAWTAGPVLGVWLYGLWQPAPFIVSFAAATALLIAFWIMRLGDGKLITRARAPAPNPFAYLGRFFRQPRLVTGWLFAVIRSCGWWAYIVYLPIFALDNGLGDKTGGIALSFSNGLLFAVPVALVWLQKTSVKAGVRLGFLFSGLGFIAAAFVASAPVVSILLLAAGSAFLILLDVCGGLPFLLAVKPSERTEMSAVYSSYRDASNIISPGVAWLVLLVFPLPSVFAAIGAGLLGCFVVAGRLHARLGAQRLKPPAPLLPPLGDTGQPADPEPAPIPSRAGDGRRRFPSS